MLFSAVPSWDALSGSEWEVVGKASWVLFWGWYLGTPALWMWNRVGTEENILKGAFGKEWERYSKSGVKRFIPGVI